MIRRCKVCGAEYKTCLSCEKSRSWRIHTDTAEHYFILGVLMDYQSGHDAEKARLALTKRGIGVDDSDGFLPGVKSLMGEIFAEGQQEKGDSVTAQPEESIQPTDTENDIDSDVTAELGAVDSVGIHTQSKRKETDRKQKKTSVESEAK